MTWSIESAAKYNWYAATSDHVSEWQELNARIKSLHDEAHQIAKDVGAKAPVFRGSYLVGFTSDVALGWKEVGRTHKGVAYYKPYNRKKSDKELNRKISDIRLPDMSDFGNKYCSGMINVPNSMAFRFFQAVLMELSGEHYFGIPKAAKPDDIKCDLSELTAVPFSEIVSLFEAQSQ